MFEYKKEITELEILNHAQKLEGKKIKDIGSIEEVNQWLGKSSNKGAIGNAIQVIYFGIPANSLKEADFSHHNLELKVTPVRKLKNNSYSSKERLVLNMINYNTDYQYTFLQSPLYKKTNQMLLIFYLYEEDVETKEFTILKTTKFIIPEEDMPTIKEDYNIIINKIKNGQAHLISEGDTTYLSACTKGAGGGKDFREQPFSKTLATQRAFSFKAGYMTTFFNSLYQTSTDKLNIPAEQSLSQFIDQTLHPYLGLTTEELEAKLNFFPERKKDADKGYLPRILNKLVEKIFNVAEIGMDRTEQFQKAHLKLKTIRIRENKSQNQDMSWPNIDFDEILNVDFENSTWYEWFVETKYLFVVFKDTPKGTILINQLIWNAPADMIDELEKLYNHIKNMLKHNEIVITTSINQKGQEIWSNNLPKKGFVKYFQIRPKGTKEHSFTYLPDGTKFKKQCLFLNKEYLHSLIK